MTAILLPDWRSNLQYTIEPHSWAMTGAEERHLEPKVLNGTIGEDFQATQAAALWESVIAIAVSLLLVRWQIYTSEQYKLTTSIHLLPMFSSPSLVNPIQRYSLYQSTMHEKGVNALANASVLNCWWYRDPRARTLKVGQCWVSLFPPPSLCLSYRPALPQ